MLIESESNAISKMSDLKRIINYYNLAIMVSATKLVLAAP